MSLTSEQQIRYGRHLILPEIGEAGQEKLLDSSVAVVGGGGLGSPVALYLAAAGVGRITIIDFDRVDVSNLQRQVLYTTADIGSGKARTAKSRLQQLNPDVAVTAIEESISSSNAMRLLDPHDLVIDGTDNFPARYLINDACVMLGKPNVYGSVFRFEGQASLFAPGEGPCYRCIFPQPPPPDLVPSCAEAGVFGVVPGIIGLIQATEAIKRITGVGESLAGRLLLFDASRMSFREIKVARRNDCVVCGDEPQIRELIDYQRFCGGEMHDSDEQNITPAELSERLKSEAALQLIDVRERNEWDQQHLTQATLMSLGEVPLRFSELDPDKDTVVYCRSGGRSGRAMQMLKAQGFRSVKNLTGGMLRWREEVDRDFKV